MLNADGLTQENTPDIQMAEVDLSAHQLAHEIESFELIFDRSQVISTMGRYFVPSSESSVRFTKRA